MSNAHDSNLPQRNPHASKFIGSKWSTNSLYRAFRLFHQTNCTTGRPLSRAALLKSCPLSSQLVNKRPLLTSKFTKLQLGKTLVAAAAADAYGSFKHTRAIGTSQTSVSARKFLNPVRTSGLRFADVPDLSSLVCAMAKFLPTAALGMNDPALYLAKVDFSEKRIEFWEQQVHACLGILAQARVLTTDEMRRVLEGMDLDATYADLDYYSRWAISMAKICLSKGLISDGDLDRELGLSHEVERHEFKSGDRVLVRPLNGTHSLARSPWRRPHLRTPGYIFGQEGTIERFMVRTLAWRLMCT
jgi:hypothetical protein